jgi:hypothetical protein
MTTIDPLTAADGARAGRSIFAFRPALFAPLPACIGIAQDGKDKVASDDPLLRAAIRHSGDVFRLYPAYNDWVDTIVEGAKFRSSGVCVFFLESDLYRLEGLFGD